MISGCLSKILNPTPHSDWRLGRSRPHRSSKIPKPAILFHFILILQNLNSLIQTVPTPEYHASCFLSPRKNDSTHTFQPLLSTTLWPIFLLAYRIFMKRNRRGRRRPKNATGKPPLNRRAGVMSFQPAARAELSNRSEPSTPTTRSQPGLNRWAKCPKTGVLCFPKWI